MKKLIAAVLLLGLFLGLFFYNFTIPQPEESDTPASTGDTAPEQSAPPAPAGQVRVENPDPSRQEAWAALAQEYTRLTGTPVTVAAPGQDQVPTIFTLDHTADLAYWKDKCIDLAGAGTDAYAQLASRELTLQSDGKVCGIAAEVEAFGLIYNANLLANMGYTYDDITGFAQLKALADHISADPELKFAAFASPDLQGSFSARLMAVPGDTRNFWDLYAANTNLLQTSAEGSLQELLDGKAVFYLGSTADHQALAKTGEHQFKILPMYIGLENEQQQSLCVTATSYWCVRSDVPQEDIQASLDFLRFLVYPRQDGSVPVDDLGLLAPYRQAVYADNHLEKALRTDLAAGKECVVCSAVDEVPALLPTALMTYTAAPTDSNWDTVLAVMGKWNAPTP